MMCAHLGQSVDAANAIDKAATAVMTSASAMVRIGSLMSFEFGYSSYSIETFTTTLSTCSGFSHSMHGAWASCGYKMAK